ncbi:MAG: hypothetical protein H6622_09970 [Halobacteriovoraceae bacterium]|nr:hypothetical protein [Halobacteriovoraceae bacterium]
MNLKVSEVVTDMAKKLLLYESKKLFRELEIPKRGMIKLTPFSSKEVINIAQRELIRSCQKYFRKSKDLNLTPVSLLK